MSEGTWGRWLRRLTAPLRRQKDEGYRAGERVYSQTAFRKLGFTGDFPIWKVALCSCQFQYRSSPLTAAAAVGQEGFHIYGFNQMQIFKSIWKTQAWWWMLETTGSRRTLMN